MNIKPDLWERIHQALSRAESLTPEERGYILGLLDELLEASGKQDQGDKVIALASELIANYNLIEIIKQHNDELDTLKKLSLNLTASLDLPTVLNAVATEAMRLVEYALSVHIFLYRADELFFGVALDSDGVHEGPPAMPDKSGMVYMVAHSGERMIIEDVSQHPLYQNEDIGWGRVPNRSVIGIPLKFNGSVVGVMVLSKSPGDGFADSELSLLHLLADQAAIAISNASLHQLMNDQAHSDVLTGLPNRRALDERLGQEIAQARRVGSPFAVVMLDLDDFKPVNDSYGHSTGDQVLKALSGRLAATLRSTDFLARYGGDEFTLVLSQTDLSSARIVTDKILEQMADFHFELLDGKQIKLGLSGGIAIYPLHAANAGDLLRAADAALYHAKRNQRGSFVVAKGFTRELSARGS